MIVLPDVETVPSNSVLLGVKGYGNLAENIRINMGNTNYFGSVHDRYQSRHDDFVRKYIEPIRSASAYVENIQAVFRDVVDEFLTIDNENTLRYIPPTMTPYLLTDERMYDLLRLGRINGWGYTADDLDELKEVHDRLLITNGHVCSENVPTVEEDGEEYFEFEYEYVSEDPILSLDDIEHIENTRKFINHLLSTTDKDPTDLDEVRG